MNLDEVKWLHVGITSKCNAKCPSCLRTDLVNLKLIDLTTARFKEVVDMLPNLETIQFCGTSGDPIASSNFLKMIDYLLDINISRVHIHTNGSLKTKKWWFNLANKLKPFKESIVWFGIDGLAGVSELYRINTNYNKVINNATEFINNGGTAFWQFLLFEHNKHQLIDCLKMSTKLKFKEFKLIKSPREKLSMNINSSSYDESCHHSEHTVVYEKDCMHLAFPSIYLEYSGELHACCYLAPRNIKLDDCQIKEELETKQYRTSCLRWCGRKK